MQASRAPDATVPTYKEDEKTFERFLQEHTIRLVESMTDDPMIMSDDDDDDDDDEYNLEPTGGPHRIRTIPCFRDHLQRIRDRHFYPETGPHSFVIEVPLDELVAWDASQGDALATAATNNTLRYTALFSKVVDRFLEALTPQQHPAERDTIDIFHDQRVRAMEDARQQQQQQQGAAGGGGIHDPYSNSNLQDEANGNGDNSNNNSTPDMVGITEDLPAELVRRYELRILPRGRKGSLPPFVHQQQQQTKDPANHSALGVPLRQVRSKSMGHLVTIRGMIVRASDVKPCCVIATYSCDACGAEVYQPVSNRREFMPAMTCCSPRCRENKKKDTLHLQTRGSKFVKFQELKLQELPNQVPMGHVPRSMSVYCRGELTRLASPGDVVTIDGVFLPQRVAESGFRAMRAGLISTTYLEAQNIIVHKKSYDESLLDSLSQEESAKLDKQIMDIATGPDPVGRLSSSIAPEIFGHEDIKRSLLLQLVGGCTRKLPDGMRIRGDINICLMGDPGVAKSQLLKHVSSIAPRGVYTTGKGSSGVGLTAAVTKDMATGEMALEGGALVLADRGICCIDEFDKMDESDRTAIHEVMEQQTVSIAKAGIVASLNARAAVLAAANPLYGRYNRNKSLSENINLPNSLLSRFDLMFLVLDIADVDRDTALARHVTFVHQNEGLAQKKDNADSDDDEDDNDSDAGEANTAGTGRRLGGDNDQGNGNDDEHGPLPPHVLREYIARARKHHPIMPPDVAPYVVEAYVSLRMQNRPGKKENDQTAMTARQLLSILRLSQALARLRFSDFVAREDVDESIRLSHMSKASLTDQEQGAPRQQDVMSRIFNIIRDYTSSSGENEVEMRLCEAMVLRKGFTVQQLQTCLEEYEALEVIQVNRARTHIYFI